MPTPIIITTEETQPVSLKNYRYVARFTCNDREWMIKSQIFSERAYPMRSAYILEQFTREIFSVLGGHNALR